MENTEVGEYVRTKEGYIAKVKQIVCEGYPIAKLEGYIVCDDEDRTILNPKEVKHSKNIFNLIKSGDILKIKEGNLVCYVSWSEENDITLEEIQERMKNNRLELLAIITKEQAKMMEYEVF